MEKFKNIVQKIFRLNEEELKVLSDLFTEESFSKNSYFANHGEYSRKIAFVNSGILRAYFQKENGEFYNKTFFTEGNFLGAYSSLITNQKNLIDIQCLTDCELLTADYNSFTALYDQYPKIERISRTTAEQFFLSKEKREIELVTLEAKERYEILKIEHPNIEQYIPQYHIASYLGITPTQLSRIRAAMSN